MIYMRIMMNTTNSPQEEISEQDKSDSYQEMAQAAMNEACEQYHQNRQQAEDAIKRGARITNHRIKL